ncbi:3TM-type holin [Hydrogenimonas sp.]
MALMNFELPDIGDLLVKAREAFTGEKVFDPVEKQKIALDLEKLENALKLGQIRINEAEAKSKFLFVAGWRPAIGWVAAVSLALMYIPKAIVMTWIWTKQCLYVMDQATDITAVQIPPFPELGAMDIIGLVGSLLGLGLMRSFEKYKGVNDRH